MKFLHEPLLLRRALSSLINGPVVLPRTIESSTMTTRLFNTFSLMTLYFNATPCLRRESVGSINVRPIYRFLMKPSLYGIPLARANPIAAGIGRIWYRNNYICFNRSFCRQILSQPAAYLVNTTSIPRNCQVWKNTHVRMYKTLSFQRLLMLG